ncbi:hypothetical protein [Hymenobacter defluvii]|uniref:Uncharacterized protein n=1 Tax=Hymenobacter defluvii TaxID=2054411 RepID=A0ABS3TFS4_9BACT|nr:hypothetical protein [Hymenobacter defluvii]MBO3272491.1 hypothetical protein [Hymenobacter defluvii]
MNVHLTRDSVAMSDDVDAPYDFRFVVPDNTSLVSLLYIVRQLSYLATIAGGKATWVASVDGKAVAVLAQQWQEPVFLSTPVLDFNVALHFEYYQQQDPQAIVDALY